MCWAGSARKRVAGQLDRLVRKTGSVVGLELELVTSVADKRTLGRQLSIKDNGHHPHLLPQKEEHVW